MDASLATFDSAGMDRLRRILRGHVDSGRVPGLVFAAGRGAETEIGGLGRLTPDGPEMAADTIFRISSLTKPIVAVVAMMLLEECALRLDHSVDEWLPELADRQVLRVADSEVDDTVPADRPLTVRDVLTYRTGYGLVLAPPGSLPIQRAEAALNVSTAPPRPGSVPDVDTWMARMGQLPLQHQPGAEWRYHTSGDILGVLVARVAGQALPELLAERIFGPLGMVDTAFFVPPEKTSRFVPQYEPTADGLVVVDDPATGQWSRPPAFPAASGGLVSTATDFLRFGRMLLAGGTFEGTRLLSRNSVDLMTTPQLTEEQRRPGSSADLFLDGQSWGLGLAVDVIRTRPWEVPGRYGWTGGLGSSWYNDPVNDLVGLLLAPTSWVYPELPAEHSDFWTTLYSALP